MSLLLQLGRRRSRQKVGGLIAAIASERARTRARTLADHDRVAAANNDNQDNNNNNNNLDKFDTQFVGELDFICQARWRAACE